MVFNGLWMVCTDIEGIPTMRQSYHGVLDGFKTQHSCTEAKVIEQQGVLSVNRHRVRECETAEEGMRVQELEQLFPKSSSNSHGGVSLGFFLGHQKWNYLPLLQDWRKLVFFEVREETANAVEKIRGIGFGLIPFKPAVELPEVTSDEARANVAPIFYLPRVVDDAEGSEGDTVRFDCGEHGWLHKNLIFTRSRRIAFSVSPQLNEVLYIAHLHDGDS